MWGCWCFSCGQEQRELTLLLIGLDNAGKTSVLNALKGDTSEVTPTFGFSNASVTAAGCKLLMYDLGGSKNIRRIWNVYTSEVHGMIYVIDAADTNRFQESHDALHKLLQSQQLAGKPLLVLANKQDVGHAADSAAVTQALGLEQLQQERPCAVYACTAKQDQQQQHQQQQQPVDPPIQQGLQWLTEKINQAFPQLQAKIDKESAEAREVEQQRKREREERARVSKLEREQQEKEAAELAQKQQQQQQLQQADAGEQLIKADYSCSSWQPTANSDNVLGEQQSAATGDPSQAAAHPASLDSPAAADPEPKAGSAAMPQSHPSSAATQDANTLMAAGNLDMQAGAGDSPDMVASVIHDTAPMRWSSSNQGQPQPIIGSGLINMLQAALPGAASPPEFTDLKQAAHDACGPTPRCDSVRSNTSSIQETPVG